MTPDFDDFAVALSSMEQAIDWTELGGFYCHEGGEQFFPDEQIAAMREAGLRIAGGLGEELASLPGDAKRSLYVGAAVAELVPILVERFVLVREVVIVNLPGGEVDALNRAFEQASADCGLAMPRISTEPMAQVGGPFDHGWLVSVLNDPEAFPALHDLLYERKGELATGRGNRDEEWARATALAEQLLDRLTPEALLTTTDEELPLLRPIFSQRGLRVSAGETGILTGVVGDPLRFCRLSNPS